MKQAGEDSLHDEPAGTSTAEADVGQIMALLCPENSAENIAARVMRASENLRHPSRAHITKKPDTIFAVKNPRTLVEFINGFLRDAVERRSIDVHVTAAQTDVEVRDRLFGQETDFANATGREIKKFGAWLDLMRGAVMREFAKFVGGHGRSEAITMIERLNALNKPGSHDTGIINCIRTAFERRKLRMLIPREKLEKLFGIKIAIKELPDESTAGNLGIGYDHGSPGALIQEHIGSLESDRRAASARIEDLKGFTYTTLGLFLEKVKNGVHTPLPLPPLPPPGVES